MYVDWNVPCISYSLKCYYGRLWDFIWWYAPCSIYIHDVYVDWNVPCISYSPKYYYNCLWYFIWWYAPCSIYIHDVYVNWNVPYISYSPKCFYDCLWYFIWWYAPCSIYMGYTFRFEAMVLLYARSHRQDNTSHGLCYTSHEALAGTRNSSVWEIDLTTHRTTSGRYTTELHLAP